jgi:hypothetical protein
MIWETAATTTAHAAATRMPVRILRPSGAIIAPPTNPISMPTKSQPDDGLMSSWWPFGLPAFWMPSSNATLPQAKNRKIWRRMSVQCPEMIRPGPPAM